MRLSRARSKSNTECPKFHFSAQIAAEQSQLKFSQFQFQLVVVVVLSERQVRQEK